MDIRFPRNREEMKRTLMLLLALNMVAVSAFLILTASGIGPLFDLLATPQGGMAETANATLYYNGTLPLYP